jgi:hypothetical protein
MPAVEDVEGLQKLVHKIAKEGKLVELRAVLEDHPEVDVDGYKDLNGWRALYWACRNGHTECARLLIDYKADVNVRDNYGSSALHSATQNGHLSCVKLLVQNGADVNCQADSGWTPQMISVYTGHLPISQYLLEQKADVHYRVSKEDINKNIDALFCAMTKNATDRTPGMAFAFLSCNTDAKNVTINKYSVTAVRRDAYIETYQQVQAFIDEYFRILQPLLSDHVQVDTRVGRGDNGIYQEPLERVLEYLGLSMSKDQVINTSIDGEAVKRALIPGHLLNANHWFDKFANIKVRAQLEDEFNTTMQHARELQAKIDALV